MEVIDTIKDGRIEIVRGVESVDGAHVELADGGRVTPDVLICATGFRRGLESLVGHLDVLDGAGGPIPSGPRPRQRDCGSSGSSRAHPRSARPQSRRSAPRVQSPASL